MAGITIRNLFQCLWMCYEDLAPDWSVCTCTATGDSPIKIIIALSVCVRVFIYFCKVAKDTQIAEASVKCESRNYS